MKCNRNKQQGMAILTMILLAVVLMAVIGGIMASSRTNASSTSSQSSNLMGSGVIEQANTIQSSVDQLLAKGTVTLASMSFDNAATTGLFNATTGTTVAQVPNPSAVSVAGQAWWYAKGGATAKGVKQLGIGTGGSSYAVLLANVTDAACLQINKNLSSIDPNTAIPSSGVAAPSATTPPNVDAQFDLSAIAANGAKDTSGNTPSAATLQGWYAGCVTTTGGANKNVFFNIVGPV